MNQKPIYLNFLLFGGLTKSAFIFPVLLILTVQTRIRFPDLPIGFGEVGLVIYVLVVWINFISQKFSNLNFAPTLFPIFWLISSISLIIGSFIGRELGVSGGVGPIRDALAYTFVAIVSLSLYFNNGDYNSCMKKLWLLGVISAITIGIFYLLGQVEYFSFKKHFWNSSFSRFIGLSANPNQFALFALATPFLCFLGMNWETFQHSTLMRLCLQVFICLTIVAGWESRSLALQVAWIFGFSLILFIYFFETWLGKTGSKKKLIYVSQTIFFSLFFILADTYFHLIFSSSGTIGAELEHFKKIEEAVVMIRFSLLQNGLEAFTYSPIFGLGPGAFSGIEHPFGGSEAHNSLLDWLISSGIIGLTALLVLLIFASVRLLREKQWELLMALGALFIFGQAHHVLRHPLVWCIFTLALLAVSKRQEH